MCDRKESYFQTVTALKKQFVISGHLVVCFLGESGSEDKHHGRICLRGIKLHREMFSSAQHLDN